MREKNRAAKQELNEALVPEDESNNRERPCGRNPTIRHGWVLSIPVRDDQQRERNLRAMIGQFGPEFELVHPNAWSDARLAEPQVLTHDDASCAHMFLTPVQGDEDIQAAVREVFESEYAFEVGVDIDYECLSRRRLYRKYSDAYEYAEELLREENLYDVLIQPVRLY